MSGQVWVSLISLGGVVLGGSLSYLVQHRTQLSAERAEQRRQRISLSEARRAERLALLERFVEVAAEAERSAFSRPSEWDDTHDWFLTTRDVSAPWTAAGPRRVGQARRRSIQGMVSPGSRYRSVSVNPCSRANRKPSSFEERTTVSITLAPDSRARRSPRA